MEIFWKTVSDICLPCDFDFWFIDDGSRDQTLNVLRKLADSDKKVHFISFSRNFGKEAALLAGLQHAEGDYVVTMDADLQHPPALLPMMLNVLTEENYESVSTYRANRTGESFFHIWLSKQFYKLMTNMSEVKIRQNACDYRMMTRKFVNAVLALSEVNRFTKGIYSWVGFETKWIAFDNVERSHGMTKWSFIKLLKYSFEGISAFSTVPLQLASVGGVVSCAVAIGYAFYVIGKTLIFGEPVQGYTTIVCLVLLTGGVNLFCMGILGFYLSKMYSEIKHRPVYLIKEER